MKLYRFYIIIGLLLLIYIVLAIYKPKQFNWDITLSKNDKNPYGAYILYSQIKDIFPRSHIINSRLPVYNQLKSNIQDTSAYVLIAPQLNLQKEDVKELLDFISKGNTVFIAAYELGAALTDTLNLATDEMVNASLGKDSDHINFTNPSLATDSGFFFRKFTLNNYFSKIDTGRTLILGLLNKNRPDFIRMSIGRGKLYIHSAPLCFSNYFMLFRHNSRYTADVLAYIPQDIKTIYWDEYYSLGPEYTGSVMSYFLNHLYLRWAWWLALFAMVMYLLFESKRRQRIIPELDPMANTTLDFVKTIGNLYFNAQDNKNIAEKKITYFLEFVRSRLYLPTVNLNEEFSAALARKSRIDVTDISDLIGLINEVEVSSKVSNHLLSQLNNKIDDFYKQVK